MQESSNTIKSFINNVYQYFYRNRKQEPRVNEPVISLQNLNSFSTSTEISKPLNSNKRAKAIDRKKLTSYKKQKLNASIETDSRSETHSLREQDLTNFSGNDPDLEIVNTNAQSNEHMLATTNKVEDFKNPVLDTQKEVKLEADLPYKTQSESENLNKSEWIVIEVEADGNCAFRAFAQEMASLDNSFNQEISELRQEVSQWLREHYLSDQNAADYLKYSIENHLEAKQESLKKSISSQGSEEIDAKINFINKCLNISSDSHFEIDEEIITTIINDIFDAPDKNNEEADEITNIIKDILKKSVLEIVQIEVRLQNIEKNLAQEIHSYLTEGETNATGVFADTAHYYALSQKHNVQIKLYEEVEDSFVLRATFDPSADEKPKETLLFCHANGNHINLLKSISSFA